MDAASCVGVAAPSALLSSRSFADAAAIARALHFSLCDYTDPPPHHHTVGATDVDLVTYRGAANVVVDAPAAVALPRASPPSSSSSAARCKLGPGGSGRAGKRRPRPSKRAPTTYISTDAATFRLMVQQVTGAQVDEASSSCLGLLMPQPRFDVVVEPAALLPPADAAYIPHHVHAAAAAADAEQPCFPTLDSWNVMYGKDEVV
uniref:VQ domain-containing protein n=1 Tax=Leersia perrieri TaxID=77586 RepID=A0A0D9VTF0_9ORYZ